MEMGRKGVVRGRFNRAVNSAREGGTRVHPATKETRGLGPVLSPRWPAGGGWSRPAWFLSVREGDGNYGTGRQAARHVCVLGVHSQAPLNSWEA